MATTKPTRTALEIFLLALIGEGVTTIYELREHAGLSVGGTQPALKRLCEDNLLRKAGKPGNRSKQAYVLTPLGRKLMMQEWRNLVLYAPQKPVAEAESILRLVSLARSTSELALAGALLDRAVAERGRRTKPREPGNGSRVARYRGFLRRLEEARLAAEAKLFGEMQAEIHPRKRH